MSNFRDTGLWRRAFIADGAGNDPHALLTATYSTFRERAATLTGQIAKALPRLTIHDVTHLDALWETADLIAGDGYPFNPAEAFVFGGAVLLHDAALCFEAYTGGQSGLREHVEWKDAFAAIETQHAGIPLDEKLDEADFSAMRSLHASRAAELGTASWIDPDGEAIYLIENLELRKHYGALIGQVAASHHWPIEDVLSKLPHQLNALPSMPREWRVDPVKVACLLRCADAAHIDSRRAPDFLRALANLHGVSADHWTAQNWLERVDRDTDDPDGRSLLFTSGKAFSEKDAQSWWVAFDAIRLVDRELRASADLLERRQQRLESPAFHMQRVTGATSPEVANETIRTNGWMPKAVEIHVGNLERLITQLGGTKLYGDTQILVVALRELIQNARDAIAARRVLDKDFAGRIKVDIAKQEGTHVVTVSDDGVGMSYRVATGPLLDFGSSFWASDLARREFPGLLASGYRSVGQFGIGFYSIFMVASSVRLSSRRFDAGLEDVTQLRFPNGLSLRPIISSGAPVDFPVSSSTKVTFVLKPEIGDPSQVLIRPGRPGYEPEMRLPLSQCLAILCAGLDTRVDLAIDKGPASVVHRPLHELDSDQDRREWLKGIVGGGDSGKSDLWLSGLAARLRPIREGENIVGLAALSIARGPSQDELATISTVGGLATTIGVGDLSRYVGYIDHKPASAKREAHHDRIASADAMQAWADEQKALLPKGDPMARYFATCSLSDLGCDPSDILMVLIRSGDEYALSGLDELIELIGDHGLAFYRSGIMPHVETHHSQGAVDGVPTFWPITNSGFISLGRDENGVANPNSILSCIERRAIARGLKIEETCRLNSATSHFGPMDIVILRGHSSS